MRHYYHYEDLYDTIASVSSNPDQIVRSFLLIQAIQEKQASLKWKFQSDFSDVNISCTDAKDYLGWKTYKDRVQALVNSDVLTFAGKKSKYGHDLFTFTEIPDFKSSKREITSQRIINSLDNRLKRKYNALTDEGKGIFENIKTVTFDLSEKHFDRVVSDLHFDDFLEHGCPDFTRYRDMYSYVWDMILRFTNRDDDREIIEFMSEDKFGNRLHSIVSSLPEAIRETIKIENEDTVEIDLKTSQMIILDYLLQTQIGNNDFSVVFNNTPDIYCYIQEKLGLRNRKIAKEVTFEMVFGSPWGKGHDQFWELFPKAAEYIEKIKTTRNPKNPSKKIHSNLAFMMQQAESEMFRHIWKILLRNNIKFVTIHDSIRCKKSDTDFVLETMHSVLESYLGNVELVYK